MANTRSGFRVILHPLVVIACAACWLTPIAQAEPPANPPAAKPEKDYAAKLSSLTAKDWRNAFAIGQELADLPAEEGWPIVRDAWPKISVIEVKQQLLKAWNYGTGFPLKPRTHSHRVDVLELGAKDGSPQVQEWATKFLQSPAGAQPAGKAPEPKGEEPAADIADIHFQDLKAGGDENRRYFLIGPRPGAKAPTAGYRLVLILPGGDGSAEFRPFVQRILKNALADDCIVANLVAPKWARSKEYVWPTRLVKNEAPKLLTEDFIDAVIKDAGAKFPIDAKRIDALGWSSSGPAVYASMLKEKSPIRGGFVAMSVFKPDMLPPLTGAAGHRFYILHSPQDFIKMNFPEAARDQLGKAGGKTILKTYEGGHGWHGDIFGTMREGFDWLEKKEE